MRYIRGIKIITIFIFTFAFFNVNTYSEEDHNNIQFKNITIEEGLSQSMVESILQDDKGYIWIGTNNGLNKYNGYNFKVYRHKENDSNSIASNYILSLKEDRDGNIWVGTSGGLSKIHRDTDNITNYYKEKDNGNLSDTSIHDILVTQDKHVLVATDDGLNIYNKDKDEFERILYKSDDLTDQRIFSMDEDEEGNIWIGTNNGLNKIEIKEKEVHHLYKNEGENSISDNSIFRVYSDKDGFVWVGTFKSGLNKINIKTNKIDVYRKVEGDKNSLPSNFVRDILNDSQGNIWICTDNGIAKYIEEEEEFIVNNSDIYDENSLINDEIFRIIEDKSGMIWIGTSEGVSMFDPNNKIDKYRNVIFNKNSLARNSIESIYEDDDRLLWIGTRDNGINLLDRKTNEIKNITEEDGLSSNQVNYIIGEGNQIWIATEDGLNLIDKEKQTIVKYDLGENLTNPKIKSLLWDRKGYLWIGTTSSVGILNLKSGDIINISEILKKNSILDLHIKKIYEDKEGNYWLGTSTSGGLVKLDPKKQTIKNYKINSSKNYRYNISANAINSIAEDNNGYLWIGTNYGLNKFDKITETFVVYTENEGLVNNNICGILIDEDDNPWISTNYGVSKLDVGKNKFISFEIADGFQNNKFNEGAYYKNKYGEFFLGGISGLDAFFTDDIKIKNYCPRVVFEEFKIQGKTYKDINNMSFNYNKNMVDIKFFLPDYKNNKNIKYYYRLSGIDKDWNSTTDPQVLYSSLKAGNYIFEVKARNHNGIISEVNKVNFTIKAHPLLSPLAFLVYIMGIIGGIYLNQNKVKKLDKLVNKRTKELTNQMKANENLFNKVIQLERNKNSYFINLSHELRTPLNVISTTGQLIKELNKNENGIPKEKIDYHMGVVSKNTERLLNLINNIIDTTKIDHGSYNINLKENDIVSIVEETTLGLKDYIESKGIELIIDPEVEEKIIECDQYEIERCIVNLVGNAIKFTPRGGKIEVGLKDLDDQVMITVSDTGIGIDLKYQNVIFDRFNQVVDANSEVKGGSGLGLTITKHMIKLHKGDIYVESEVNLGSKFVIILPVKINK